MSLPRDAVPGLTEAITRTEQTPAVPTARLRAMVRLLWPDEITPAARRQLERLCDEYEEQT